MPDNCPTERKPVPAVRKESVQSGQSSSVHTRSRRATQRGCSRTVGQGRGEAARGRDDSCIRNTSDAPSAETAWSWKLIPWRLHPSAAACTSAHSRPAACRTEGLRSPATGTSSGLGPSSTPLEPEADAQLHCQLCVGHVDTTTLSVVCGACHHNYTISCVWCLSASTRRTARDGCKAGTLSARTPQRFTDMHLCTSGGGTSQAYR